MELFKAVAKLGEVTIESCGIVALAVGGCFIFCAGAAGEMIGNMLIESSESLSVFAKKRHCK